jgi:RNase P/RNase MRP subunit POP5
MTKMGICGDDCLYCPRYVATQSGKAGELEKVKELWLRLGLGNPALSAEDMVCFGCAAENDCAYSELRACVYGKAIENCGLCETYPCELVDAAFEKSEKLRSRAVLVCTREEMEALQKAFFSKQQNLDQKHNDGHGEDKRQ